MGKKIVFLLGSANMSGGTYVILQHALYLQQVGYEVSVALVFMTYPEYIQLKNSEQCWHPAIKKLSFLHIHDCAQYEYDIAIFTWWATVFSLEKIKTKQYLYFVQSIESRFYRPEQTFLRDLVSRTYQLGMPVITEATWIKNYLKQNFHTEAHLVKNGLAKAIYQTTGPTLAAKSKQQLRILVEGPLEAPYKNVARTIALCQQAQVGEVWLLTSSPVKYHPGVSRVFSQVPIERVAEIYRSCDVLVKLSYVEGMFGPPLEMFHCGGTAIVYDVTGYDEYIQHEVNALVAKTDDEQAVIHYLRMLHSDRALLARLIAGAKTTADQWPDWPSSSAMFTITLEQIHQTAAQDQQKEPLLAKFRHRFTETIPVLIQQQNQTKEIPVPATPLYDSGHYALTIPLTSPLSKLAIIFGKLYQNMMINKIDVFAHDGSAVNGNLQIEFTQMTRHADQSFQCDSEKSAMHLQIDVRSAQTFSPASLYCQIQFAPVALRLKNKTAIEA